MSPISQRETVPANAVWMSGLNVPAHWTRTKVKHLVRTMRAGEAIPLDHISESGQFPVYGANGKRGYTDNKTHEGTYILIGRQGARCGNVHLVSEAFWASEHAIVSAPAAHINPNWLAYLLDVMNLGQYSTNAAQPGIGVGQIGPIPVYAPGFDEQRAIADFLDRETSQIDALIARQNSLIEVVFERLAAVLTQHFQSSDGKRPVTVRQVLTKLARPAPSGLGVVTAYRDGVVTLRANRREDGYTFSDTEAGYQEVFPGDIVFHALDGFAGAVGASDSHGVCTPVYHVCRPKGADDPEYIALLLRYLGTSGFLAIQAPTVRQRSVDFRNWSTFARVPLMLPSASEQQAFMSDFRARKASVDAIVAKTRQHVEFAKERRAALMSAAVTGQIDVTGRSMAS